MPTLRGFSYFCPHVSIFLITLNMHESIKRKEGKEYLNFIFHPKCSKLCHSPSYEKILLFLTPYYPLKMWLFARVMLFPGLPVLLFFIQNGLYSAQPLLWVPKSPVLRNSVRCLYSSFVHDTKYVHIKSTTVYAPRRNWDSPQPPTRRLVCPVSGGRVTLAG